jgi:hypothetical protein
MVWAYLHDFRSVYCVLCTVHCGVVVNDTDLERSSYILSRESDRSVCTV